MSNNIRLLVVEDDADILYLVLKHMRNNGFLPDGFTDPLIALEQFKSNPSKYALVLTDIRMPNMTGIALAQAILKINANTKIVLMTAHEEFADEIQTKLPVVTYEDIIRKPFQLVQICNRVRQLVNAG